MKVRLLHLTNYRRHHDTRIEFPDGVTAVLGRNGSGKSTLLEALGFALFGVGATRTGKDLLRSDQAAPGDPVRVDAELELDGEAIRITRELRGKNLTPQATLTVGGQVLVPMGAGSSDAVTKELERRIGMDRDAFFATVVARQKELARLGDLGPAERKRLILGMLGVDALDRAISMARGRRRDAEAKVEALRGELPDRKVLDAAKKGAQKEAERTAKAVQKAEVSWKQTEDVLAQAEKRLQTAEKAHEERRRHETDRQAATKDKSAAATRMKDLEPRLQAAREAASQIKSLRPVADRLPAARKAVEDARKAAERRARIEALQAKHDAIQIPGDLPDIKVLEKEAAHHAAEARRLGEETAVLRSGQQELQKRLEKVAELGEAAPCPTCERPMAEHLPRLREVLQQDADERKATLKDVQEAATKAEKAAQESAQALQTAQRQTQEADALHRERERLAADIAAEKKALPAGPPAELEALEAAMQEAEEAQRALARAEALASEKDALDAALKEARKASEAAAARLGKVEKALAGLPDTAPALAQAKQAHVEAATTEREAEKALLQARHDAETAAHAVGEVQARIDDAKARRERLNVVEEEARYWGALAGGRGRGLLEAFKGHLVSRIGPAVSQEAGRLLGLFTGGRYTEVLLDDEYHLYVADGGVHYTLDRFSGGESDLVHLALRLAVSRLLLERSGGAEMRLLALDEVFGSLDEERRHAVLGALQELGGLYSQVLLVTHQDALRDALDAVMHVEEVEGRAVVTMHKG